MAGQFDVGPLPTDASHVLHVFPSYTFANNLRVGLLEDREEARNVSVLILVKHMHTFLECKCSFQILYKWMIPLNSPPAQPHLS